MTVAVVAARLEEGEEEEEEVVVVELFLPRPLACLLPFRL